MYKNKTVGVVVPCYNEGKQIGDVIETMPDFVDRIIIINDCSLDNTLDVVKSYFDTDHNKSDLRLTTVKMMSRRGNYEAAEKIIWERNQEEMKYFTPSEVLNKNPESERIILINFLEKGGKGGGVARGYKWAKDYGLDCTAIMDGDGQMDPYELESICKPVIEEEVDYVKGNRLKHASAFEIIPKTRFLGNSILSILTKIASGYWRVSDTQSGYTAISKNALNAIQIYKIYHSYGVPNDILVKLNIAFCTIKEVVIKPVYNIGEQSKMKVFKIILPISLLLLKSFFKRLWIKYLFKDFHPLFLLYHLGIVLLLISIPFLINLLVHLFKWGSITPEQNVIFFVFLTITGFQSLFFAMWMDIQDNDRLNK
ncbi:MAG: glycosyltransferase family 2 protein [Bacteroidales bacterium]